MTGNVLATSSACRGIRIVYDLSLAAVDLLLVASTTASTSATFLQSCILT